MNASVSVPTPAEGEPGGGASSSSGAAEGPTGAGAAVAEATTLGAKKTRAELRAASAGTERHWHPRRWLVAALVVVLVGAVALVAVVRLRAPLPSAEITPGAGPVVSVSGSPAPLAWPSTGEAAVAIPKLGVVSQSGAEAPVPVASLTKVMTAYLVLKDHPLPAGDDGPSFTMTAADAAAFVADSGQDQSSVEVAPGEVLDERQLLDGLLVHSANNFADFLAAWDAGSTSAFVTEMNAEAAALGMHNTHFVDDSGFNAQSVSTPADMLKVATLALQEPAFAAGVAMPDVTLPVAGQVSSYTPLVGTENVIGVKSGFTDAAGGCDILALHQVVAGQSVVVLAAVTGQQGADVLGVAGAAAHALAQSASAQIVAQKVLTAGEEVAKASTVGEAVPVVTTRSAEVLAWPGQHATRTLEVTAHPVAGTQAGALVGTANATLGTQVVHAPARTTRALPRPSLAQRLF